jgi:hypothetical protein
MHLLYPEMFDENDLDGEKNWDYDWAVENTWSKWFPEIFHIHEKEENITIVNYQTARSPNNWLLLRLHKLLDKVIINYYREPLMHIEWYYICELWKGTDLIIPAPPTQDTWDTISISIVKD